MKHNSTQKFRDELLSSCAEIDAILMGEPFVSRAESEDDKPRNEKNDDPSPTSDSGEVVPCGTDAIGQGEPPPVGPPGKRSGHSRGRSKAKSPRTTSEDRTASKYHETPPHDRLLRLREIIGPGGLIPISRSAWWLGIKQGRYPAPVRVGLRAVAWRLSDLVRIVRDGVE